MTQVVWFKRDLRTRDHWPLAEACRKGAVLPLYIIEPGYWQQPDSSARQWAFIAESLRDLRRQLARLGLSLWVVEGNAVEVSQSCTISWVGLPCEAMKSTAVTGPTSVISPSRAGVKHIR